MKKLVFLLIFISINIVFVEAQEWKIAKGIKDTNLKAIAADKENSDVIYIGSRFIYKTENSGEDWQKVWTLPAMAKVNFLLAEGKTVYAATEKGLFKSDDDGENWQRIFREIDEENNILCLDWDRQNNLLYIGTQDGLFRNRDNGNWQKSKGKLGNAEIYGIKISPENADAIYVISNEGFFKTDNRGKNWKRTFIISKIAEEEEQEETNQQMNRLNDLVIAQKAIYLTGRDILLKSEDKGETWQEMSKEVLEGADIRSIVVFGNRIFLGTDRGVFKRRVKGIGKRVKGEEIEKKEQEGEEENGEGWEEIYVGLSSLDIQKVILAGDDLWAITGKGLFKLQVAGYRLQVKDEEENKILEEKDKEVNIEQQIFELFVHEPTIREVQEKAIEYAEVHPNKIKNWRRLSAKRALLPKLSVGVDGNKDITLGDSIWGSYSSGGQHYIGPDDKTVYNKFGWDVSLSWELGDLIWNDAQTNIDVRSRLMVQLREDVLDEATRTYFERKRLKIELFLSPLQDEEKKIAKGLRLEELTASLDALTGGWFSDNITDFTDKEH